VNVQRSLRRLEEAVRREQAKVRQDAAAQVRLMVATAKKKR